MDAGDAISVMGGVATTQALRTCCTVREIREAVDAGRIVRAARGIYALRSAADSEAARARMSGTLVCLSAAQHHRCRDVWRYTSLVAQGWTVLRFTHRHVMTQEDWVAEILSTFLPTGKQLP